MKKQKISFENCSVIISANKQSDSLKHFYGSFKPVVGVTKLFSEKSCHVENQNPQLKKEPK